MYKKEFDNILKSKKIPNYILLRGNDEFQNELYANQVAKFFNSDNFLKIYFDEYDFETCKDFLQPSLFSNSAILHIKANKSIPAKQAKELIEICKKEPSSVLIFELNEENNKANADFVKCFDKNDVRFFKPSNPNEALMLLNTKCQILKINASTPALMKIYEIHNENLSLCGSEIEKFTTLGIDINLENVQNLVFGLSEVSFEELFNKIINLKDFRDDFFSFTQSGLYNEVAFINYIYNSIFRIFKIHTHIKTTGKFDLISVLGYNPPNLIANELKKQATMISTKTFFKIFKHLNECEFTLKTSNELEKNFYLLSAILKLQKILQEK